MLKLTIDGKEVSARPEQTILEVARENGIHIPTLCYHEKLSLIKSCRICLVEVEGAQMPVASCATPIVDGMVVRTRTERVERMRREALRLLLVNHPLDCPVCDAGGECHLQNRIYEFGIERNEFPPEKRDLPASPYGTPLIRQWFDRCVMCLRCVHACIDVPGADVLDVVERGFPAHIEAVRRDHCISCGECLHVCPVGALTENLSPIKGRTWQLKRTRTTCPYCGCGCQFELNTLGNRRVVKVTTKEERGVNQGSLCVKGRFGYDVVNHPDRLKKPLVKKDGAFVETSWAEALDWVAARLRELKERFGPQAIGGLASPRATNEESYLFQKWMRACIGTNNIDSAADLASGAAIRGMNACLGIPGMTHPMDHVEEADLLLVIGADPYEDNLIFSNKMRLAIRRNNAKVVVVDPRQTQWEKWADLWLRPLPGSDRAWINALSRLLIEGGSVRKDFIEEKTEGFDSFRASLERFSPEFVKEVSGVTPSDLEKLARLYKRAGRRAIIFGSGVMQNLHGMEIVQALCNLALVTGETEEEGGGLYPMLPQSNGQGALDMGVSPDHLPGYRSVEDGKAREAFEKGWKRPIPPKPGFSYMEMLDRIEGGEIRGLYLMGEDPLITLPNLEGLQKRLSQIELLVVQDAFMPWIGKYAQIVLPGVSFAEKDGTFTSMEGRVQRVRQAISPVGESRADWKILCDLSTKMGYPMDYESPAEVMAEIASLVPSYKGIDYGALEQEGKRRATEKKGRLKFFPATYVPPLEKPNQDYPLWVIPRGFHYYSAMGMETKRARGLSQVFPDTAVEVHPQDAKRIGIETGERVRVRSPRGVVETTCRVTESVPAGVAYFATTFFPVSINSLLAFGSDARGKRPEYKVFIGRVEKI